MAISSEFRLVFVNGRKEQEVRAFAGTPEQADQMSEDDIITVNENSPLSVHFTSKNHPSLRLSIDGFEFLPDTLYDGERNEYYLLPQEEEQTLYENGDYPLIPGYYTISVHDGEEACYGKLHVLPTQLSVEEWRELADEIDTFVNGLAEEFILTKEGAVIPDRPAVRLPMGVYNQLLFLEHNAPTIIRTLDDLTRKANYRIEGDHELLPSHKVRRTDNVSIRYLRSHPTRRDRILAPIKKLTYDIPENRLLKHDLKVMKAILQRARRAGQAMLCHLQEEYQESLRYQGGRESVLSRAEQNYFNWQEGEKRCRQLEASVERLQGAPFLSEVDETCPRNAARAVLDWRYNYLHRITRALEEKDARIQAAQEYQLQRKRTDKLYEIWGFIRIMQTLQGLGYTPTDGWIYRLDAGEKDFVVPMLASGEAVTYKSGARTLRLVYNEPLPQDERQIDHLHPLYIAYQHNRPDARLDLYHAEVYEGSVIIDFKYRRASAMVNRTYGDVFDQLRDYKEARSRIYSENGFDLSSSYNPVHAVLVLCPNIDTTSRLRTPGTKLLEEAPKRESSLASWLAKEIDQIHQVAQIMHIAREDLVTVK
ncbi:DUF2357 domain-containing protein [Mitsuokella jalaludinii]|uniref:DUF2357 domain-containing protein n=1 Tax=Mitsuokella jalaludinii TaxID=187979 RepID=UPI003F88D8FD